jgi:hypothetical protein
MSRFPHDYYVQYYGCWALAWLAEDSETNGAAIGSAGGIELAEAAMSRFPDNYGVPEYCKLAVESVPVASIERVPQPSAWLRWRDVCKVLLLPLLFLCLGMAVGRCIYTHRSRQRTNIHMAGIRGCCACRCITAALPTSEPQEGLTGTKLVEMLRQTTVWIPNPLSSPLALRDPSSSDPEILSASSSESLAVDDDDDDDDDDDTTLRGCGSDDATAVAGEGGGGGSGRVSVDAMCAVCLEGFIQGALARGYSSCCSVLCLAQLHTLVCSLTGSACLPFAMLVCWFPHNYAVCARRPAADCAAAVQPQISRRLHRTLSQP